MSADLELEAMQLFRELSPENQNTLLMYTHIAHVAENAVKKNVNRALCNEEESQPIISTRKKLYQRP
jgi:ABC-type lipoprotein export system ATPase subunit